MGLLHTLSKVWRGQPLDWPLPNTISSNECIARCARCSTIYVMAKSERRTTNYCWSCK
jgi:hypothetical protein